jgi:uncharacterized lipoprotein YajG
LGPFCNPKQRKKFFCPGSGYLLSLSVLISVIPFKPIQKTQRMKKVLVILAMGAFFASCGGAETKVEEAAATVDSTVTATVDSAAAAVGAATDSAAAAVGAAVDSAAAKVDSAIKK